MQNTFIEAIEHQILDFVSIVLRQDYVVALEAERKRIVNIQITLDYE